MLDLLMGLFGIVPEGDDEHETRTIAARTWQVAIASLVVVGIILSLIFMG